MTDHSHDYASNPGNLTHYHCCRDENLALCGHDVTDMDHTTPRNVDCPPCLERTGSLGRCPHASVWCPVAHIVGQAISRVWMKVRR